MTLLRARSWWSLVALAAALPAVAGWYLLFGATDLRVYLVEVALPVVVAAELLAVLAATRGEWRWASRPAHVARWVLAGGIAGFALTLWFAMMLSLEGIAVGQRIPLALNGVAVGMSFGAGVGYLYTELEERRHELRRQNDRLDEFAGVVSHDLRNPLGVARGRLELAAETGEERHFETIERAHGRMEQLIEELLVLARAGADVTETEPTSLAAVAERAAGTVRTDVLRLELADATVECDPERLRTLLENLLRNSVEHGSEGSRTESGDAVERGSTTPRSEAGAAAAEHGSPSGRAPADDAGGQLAADSAAGVDEGAPSDPLTVRIGPLPAGGFYVEDDGSGIPREGRDRLFEPGYSTTEDGTGFGLAIVRRIADAHGWEVVVAESEAGGARFEFRP